MSDFHEVSFPVAIGLEAEGGPERHVNIVETSNGFEHRNSARRNSRCRYSVPLINRDADELHELKTFFEARGGKLFGFRFKDYSDFQSCPPMQAISPNDQVIGTGGGSVTSFQMVKLYADALGSWVRAINKPIAGTVQIAIDGAPASGWSVDTTSGVVSFDTAPEAGAQITAGFAFEVPVRFDVDRLPVQLSTTWIGSAGEIQLIEVRV
ncbi:DUF2460 domain-containing protein [uncultured Pelagimonas sp.]|uniref:DUF2460 domain-containing protein n=1 Tax=uncultured Pelagimonas sp. TaxID=1618102 RepID=UPI0026083DBD|nr:DUF2460 domain-containing protein [uncultured Pelagimonas sp.]